MIEEKEQTVADNGNILCEKVNQIKYYADVTKSFAEQVPQYQMPKEHTVIWKEGDNFRVEKSLSEYDEYCNITLQQDFDETKTIFTYYNANGEAGACPAAPHGFKQFIKEQTLYPSVSDFQTPIRKTLYKYDSYPVRNSHSLVADKMVLLRAENYFSDNAQIKRKEIQYYNDVTSTNHGRVLEKKVWVSENCNETASFKEEYQWTILNNNNHIRCITKLTGLKDNLSVSKEQCWTSRAYRLIMEKDTQNNITRYGYNKLGQIISNTLNFNTQYENRMEYSWSFLQSGIPISVIMTDTVGNKYQINMDGQGRLVEKYYFTQQVPNGFKIESRQYNLFGQLNSTTHYDLLNPGESSQDICKATISFKDNYWRENVSQEHSNGTSINDIYEPIRNQSRQQIVSLIDNRNASSIIQKEYNTRGQLVKLVQLKTDAITQYKVWQFFIDGLGRIRKTIDESNNITLFEYDEFDRVNKQILADGTTIKKLYKDGLATQISLTAKDGIEKILGTQQFDSLGRLTNSQTGGRNTTLT